MKKPNKNIRGFFLVALAMLAPAGAGMAAEAYPVKPLRIIVPFSPGGFVDFTARLIAAPMAATFGQQMIVDNRGGAGGIVGSEAAARSAPDGYTLVIGSLGTHAVNQSLYPDLSYNVLRDFQPVARLADAPSILAVHPSLPVRSVKDLLALGRTRPRQINYASAGSGTSTHLAAVLFEHLGKVQMVHVPFKGGGPALVSVVSGEVPVTFGTAASVTPHTKSGRLRALAVTSGQRSSVLPELPTMAEGGLPGYEMLNWLGLFAPKGTPPAVVEKLGKEAIRAVQLPQVVKQFNAHGAEPSVLGADEFSAFIKSEIGKWSAVVAATGMKAN